MFQKFQTDLRGGSAFAAIWIALAGASAQADVVVSSDATQNMTCSGGVCSPTASAAVLNVSDLETLLASGNVQVTTTGSGVQAGNIDVEAALTWSNSSALSLAAASAIAVSQGVSVTGTGGMSLTSTSLSFAPGGNVTFADLSSTLSINGTSYVLVNSVAGVAALGNANRSAEIAFAQSYDATGDGTYSGPPVTAFYGSFEGLGNTISNLSIYQVPTGQGNATGLFGIIQGATVRDIGLLGVNITGAAGGYVGALAGDDASSNISGVYSTGMVTADGTNSFETGGGLIGWMYPVLHLPTPVLSNSYSTALVEAPAGNASIGGLVGIATSSINKKNPSTIENCYATGQFEGGADTAAGGLIAANDGTIKNSFATGAVSIGDLVHSNEGAGGLVAANNGGKIQNSYATGSVTAGQNANVGGLIGLSTPPDIYEKSYASGQVTGGTGSLVGGLIGYVDTTYGVPNLEDLYWDTDTSGTSSGTGNEGTPTGMTGLTTSQFQSRLPTGFGKKVWALNPGINGGYPYLIGNPPP